jgi:outer membrane protein OmpA-like peptidoglycan-associated protein
MASSGDSQDSADTFWPGYVDAISNLAINLLFVIAVMAIVVIGSTLQLSELMKRKDLSGEDGVAVSTEKTEQAKAGPGVSDQKVSASTSNSGAGVAASEEVVRAQAQTIKQQAEQIKQLQVQLNRATAEYRGAGKALGLTAENDKVDVVTARTPVQVPEAESLSSLLQGGVVVRFGRDVIELTKEEIADLVIKVKQLGPLNANSKWRITVLAPKGLSEGIRLGFYRANVVRNMLLQQGVQGSNIDLKVLESDRGDADSARVIVRAGA